MRIIGLTAICLTLFVLGSAHHGGDEERLLTTLIAAHAESNVIAADNAINNYIDTLLRKFLEKVRSVIKTKEPYPVPDFPPQNIDDKNVRATLTLKNVTENYASSFVINDLENQFFLMTEAFNVTFPKLEFAGKYHINGTVLNRKVKGDGDFNVSLTNLTTWGKAYAHIVDGYVQLEKLPIDYTVESITATATGLTVKGLKQKQVQKLLQKELLQYFTDNEKIVCATISELVLNEVNTLLYGMSFSDFIEWLKHFIQPPIVKSC